ncbi:DnaJ domain-containing protein [Silvanigrella paludirubra]|uniref:DnaJ domain-containing protein n=1 Tax=Silvanigrella paludirubra TaxID=2499159 RepID=A0A6N6VYY8_9BACT|nr:J domain-containing protein [Silvanigrella paludirubra]KAB8040446.1 DnaJ domain-containing protein [Silvanigrella paludirubra]
MDNDFIDEDLFEALRRDAEKKRLKKLEKQERLEKRKIALQELQNILEIKHLETENDFDSCLLAANKYKMGTIDWALAFLNLSEINNSKEIRDKYLKLAQNWHPDKNAKNSNEAMKYLNEAWQILKKNI